MGRWKKNKEVRGTLEVKRHTKDTNDTLVTKFKRECKKSGLQSEIRKHFLDRHKTKSEKRREKRARSLSRRKAKSKL